MNTSNLNIKLITPSSNESEEICNLIIQSITKICAKDYNHDPKILKDWLDNKTPENVASWISNPNNISLVAIDTLTNKLAAFILINKTGEILLNYLLPHYLHKGIGKLLLQKLENTARKQGLKSLSAVSTITAKNFYEKNGFVKNGEPGLVGSICGDFPLIKYLDN